MSLYVISTNCDIVDTHTHIYILIIVLCASIKKLRVIHFWNKISFVFLVSPQASPSAGALSNVENFSRLPNNFGGQMEVYVSAVASPTRFWVQIVSPQIKKLDALIQEMTEYYGQDENKEKHRIKDAYLGQIVAAMFQYDSKWYRAEIVAIVPNEYDPRRVALDLYFLDFGDSIYVDPQDVFELRTDFLTLR